MVRSDEIYESVFGPPKSVAADLHELRVWAHSRTTITPTNASVTGRELCKRIDPTWPERALTNERVMAPPETRPRTADLKIRLAESTVEVMAQVASRSNASSTRKVSFRNHETLWPAQQSSWQTWVMMVRDMTGTVEDPEMTRGERSLDLPYIAPAELMMAVREGGSPYLDAIGEAMEMGRPFWKFGCTVMEFPDMWTMGLNGFRWLDLFPKGELAMWLRSVVCNGWACSGQLARYMGLESARSCTESWIR